MVIYRCKQTGLTSGETRSIQTACRACRKHRDAVSIDINSIIFIDTHVQRYIIAFAFAIREKFGFCY